MSRNRNRGSSPAQASTVDRLPNDRRSIDQHRFAFRTLAGNTIDVPAPGFVPLPVLIELTGLEGVSEKELLQHLPLIWDIADTAEGRDGLMKLGLVEINRFFRLWGRQVENANRSSAGKAPA